MADSLRVEAARARCSVAEVIRRRVTGLGGGEPSGGLRDADSSAATGIVAGVAVGPSSPPPSPGRCAFDAPKGTRCKVCGKVH